METQTQTKNLNVLMENLQNKRQEIRHKLISEIANSFIEKNKANSLIAFPREHISLLTENLNVSERQKDRITNEIIAFLKDAKLIKETPISKAYYSYKNVVALKSSDYDSYKILMQVNKNKPLDKKGCYSQTGNKSFFKYVAVRKIKSVYELV